MRKRLKKYEELTIVDDFMFGKVMRHPGRCKRLLEIILGLPIHRIEFLEEQESMNPDYHAKGIRLDIYLEDEGDTVYNVEMQADNTGTLPWRSRYYQSVIDINMIEKSLTCLAGADTFTILKTCAGRSLTFDLGMGRRRFS